MARTSTKRRAAPQSFEDFAQMDRAADPARDTDYLAEKAAASGEKGKPSVDELLAKINQLEGRMAERATMPSSQTVRVEAPIVEPARAPALDLKGLPDPIRDHEAYNTALQERVSKYTDASLTWRAERDHAAAAAGQSQEQKATALWEDFVARFPDLAKDEDRVTFAVQQVGSDLRKRGMDLPSYMDRNRDQFLDLVGQKYEKTFGVVDTGETEVDIGEEEVRPRRRRATAEEDTGDTDGRSAGIFGGEGPTAVRRGAAHEAAGDMVKEIQEMQRKTGLI